MTSALRHYAQQILYGGIIVLSLLALVCSTILVPTANAATVDTPLDCDTNAVLYCGGKTTTEIHSKYNKSPDAQAIYEYFGISDWNMRNLTKNAVVGKVTKGGRVLVDGKEVATNVLTAGRVNMAGSKTVTHKGVTFYVRSPGASFQQQSLPAFVVLNKDGSMKHAIIASCGNPVMTTQKEQPPKPEKPAPEQPTPTPPAPQPQPPAPEQPQPPAPAPVAIATNITNVTVQQQQQQQEQQAPPAPTEQAQEQKQEQPAPTQQQQQAQVLPAATVPAAKELPKTGPAQALQLVALSSLGATFAHMLHTRRKNRQLDI